MSKNIIKFNYFNKKNYIIYNNKYFLFSEIKKKILNFKNKNNNQTKGIVSLSSRDKINFLIYYIALQYIGFPVYLNDNNSITKILKEKLNINYIIKNNKLFKIRSSYKKNFNYSTIIKTSGSTKEPRFVLLKNETLSFVSKNLNKFMDLNKKKLNELIFAPIDHAFGFARIHSLIISNNNFILTDNYSFSNLFELKRKYKFSALSIPAKILSVICEMNNNSLIKELTDNLEYIHISTGHFPLKYRKKLLKYNTNLYINYGSTEAMRTTFLDCKKIEIKFIQKENLFQE